jgi:hypothetical protein
MSDSTAAIRWRWLVAPGERRALIAAAAAYFLLLGGYYMLRSLREAFALEVGREHIATLFYITFGVMLLILPLYWFVVALPGDLFKRRALVCCTRSWHGGSSTGSLAGRCVFRRGDVTQFVHRIGLLECDG